MPVIILLEVIVEFLCGLEKYGYVVRAHYEEYYSYPDRRDTDNELCMEREGEGRDTVKERERGEGRGKGRENVWERVIGRERAKGRGREIGRDGVR